MLKKVTYFFIATVLINSTIVRADHRDRHKNSHEVLKEIYKNRYGRSCRLPDGTEQYESSWSQQAESGFRAGAVSLLVSGLMVYNDKNPLIGLAISGASNVVIGELGLKDRNWLVQFCLTLLGSYAGYLIGTEAKKS
jgi:hypothetical protein